MHQPVSQKTDSFSNNILLSKYRYGRDIFFLPKDKQNIPLFTSICCYCRTSKPSTQTSPVDSPLRFTGQRCPAPAARTAQSSPQGRGRGGHSVLEILLSQAAPVLATSERESQICHS